MKLPAPEDYQNEPLLQRNYRAWNASNTLLIKAIGHIERTLKTLEHPTDENVKIAKTALNDFLKTIEK